MDLGLIRKDIDKIDSELTRLFQERMKLTYKVAESKIATGKKVYDKEREESKLAALSELAEDEFNSEAIRELFTQIMTISRRKQYALVKHDGEEYEGRVAIDHICADGKPVACFGEPGSYTEQAMIQQFGEDVKGDYKATFGEVLDAIQNGEAQYGVLPIENSSTGCINDIYDLIAKSEISIVGEQVVKVEQTLIGLPGAKIEDIEVVYSHPQGILQCRPFLKQYPQIQAKEYASTSASVKKVAEEKNPKFAAISSVRAAKMYGLEVLRENINDQSNNSTRFIIITNQKVYRKDGNKVSICVEIKHESGTLYNMLSNFMFNHLNLTQIESRPIEDKKWEYRFFIEFEGNLEDAGVQNALRGVKEEATKFYLYGCFK
ncbi:MAG: prephenate dehydratase [Lachnospiraceae bacterium]|nr:prephenate dehydratase [Lachnospiraceae bacterium]